MTAGEPRSRPVVRQLSEDLLLVEVDGQRFEVASACPHRKGLLVHGYLNATLRITCPLHHSSFDLATGRRTAGPSSCDLAVTVLDRP